MKVIIYDEDCLLCKAEKITKRYYEDDFMWIADCQSHPDKKMCVIKQHISTPTLKEKEYMYNKMTELFPGIRLRGPKNLEHYHIHEL